MKKYISSLFIFSAIALIALSFKTESSKIGPNLKAVLDNTSKNDLIVYVYLRDKGPNALSELSNPLNLVTQRSINRRLKVKSPDKVVGFTDIPIYQEYVNEISPNVLNVRNRLKWLNAISVELNRVQLDRVAAFDFVKQVELVESFKRVPEPESDYAPLPQNNNNVLVDTLDYGTSFTQINQIKVNLVHDQGIYGQGILLASLDDGFKNQTHPCFTNPVNPIQIVSQYDFQLHLPGAYRTNASHGTTTISCIGAYAPGHLIGTAFKSKFLVARTEVDSFERPIEMDNWIAASQWADSLGADIITSSLGYLAFDSPYPGYTWQDMNGHTLPVTIGADIAVDNGITVFNSAGNNGLSSQHNTLIGPADGDSVITLGAVNSSGTRSSFSSVGPTTDNPPRIKPDVMAMGSGVTTANGSGSGYSTFSSGTSYSCPIAAGVGALILSANKSLTPIQVRGILRKFASNSSSPNNLMGWGIIDAQQSVDSARKLDNEPPVITHTQPFTYTTNTGTITMKAKITDNGIIRFWANQAPLLYYRKSTDNGNTWTSYTAVDNNYYNNVDSLFFPIPGSTAGTRVEYYFAAQDIALPTPNVATLPAGGGGVTPPGSIVPPARFSYDVVLEGITGNTNEIPREFKLYNNYPNPFNPSTNIKFDIPRVTNAKLIVYDVLGREVSRIFEGRLKAGSYTVDFDASNLPSGVYFYRLTTNSFTDTKKMLLIK